jgi:hypothetical protein
MSHLGNRHSSVRGNRAFSVKVIIQRRDGDEIGTPTITDQMICSPRLAAAVLHAPRRRGDTSLNEAKPYSVREAKQS